MSKITFKRDEIKYRLSFKQLDLLLPILKEMMDCDEYCIGGQKYLVTSIYYDTENGSSIRRSREKPLYKAKLRLRRYGEAEGTFLELKKKFDGIVYKRRLWLDEEETKKFQSDFSLPIHREDYLDQIILKEIVNFMGIYRDLKPYIKLFYNRIAFVGRDPGDDLRITIDSDVTYSVEEGGEVEYIIPPEGSLLEVKISKALPLWLVHVLTRLEIFPISFSKVGVACKNRIEEKINV